MAYHNFNLEIQGTMEHRACPGCGVVGRVFIVTDGEKAFSKCKNCLMRDLWISEAEFDELYGNFLDRRKK